MAMKCRSMTGQDRYAKVIFDRQRSNDEDKRHAGYVANVEALHSNKWEQKIEQPAGGTCACVKFLAEDERHLVDANVSKNAAKYRRHDAQDNRAPRLIAVDDGFLQADDHEEGYGDGIEEKPGDLSADEPPPEQSYRNDRQRGRRQVERIRHPERLDAHQHVAERSAANRRDEAYDTRAKPVEMFHACKAYAGNGTRKGTDEFKRAYEKRDFIRKV